MQKDIGLKFKAKKNFKANRLNRLNRHHSESAFHLKNRNMFFQPDNSNLYHNRQNRVALNSSLELVSCLLLIKQRQPHGVERNHWLGRTELMKTSID